jgi:hypothetical protein
MGEDGRRRTNPQVPRMGEDERPTIPSFVFRPSSFTRPLTLEAFQQIRQREITARFLPHLAQMGMVRHTGFFVKDT